VLYVWRAELGDALDRIGHDAAVYHIDDEYTFSPVEKPLDEREARLIRRVDEVIVHSPALLEKKGRLNPNTRMIPNGVDFAALVTSRSEPSDLAGIPRPRVGYVGVIKEQLDLPLLATLAERHPDWHFVLVGPNQARPAAMTRLNARPNVHLLGAKPVTDVPAYLQHMDVGIMPYVLDGYTKFIYPLKLHEYFASGLPVVATPVRSVLAFRGLVTLAEGEPAWSAALADALAGKHGGPADVAARRSVAAAHDWDDLVLQIANTLCESLGQPSFGLR
jgi:glycosyltransferase involved in cell wall biosynthesis